MKIKFLTAVMALASSAPVVCAHSVWVENTADRHLEGRLHFTAPSPGLVLLTCNHKENVNGFAAGAAYDVIGHNTALTWRQP